MFSAAAVLIGSLCPVEFMHPGIVGQSGCGYCEWAAGWDCESVLEEERYVASASWKLFSPVVEKFKFLLLKCINK